MPQFVSVIIVTKYRRSGVLFNQRQQLQLMFHLQNVAERDTKKSKNNTGLSVCLHQGAHGLVIHPRNMQTNGVCCSTVELRGQDAGLATAKHALKTVYASNISSGFSNELKNCFKNNQK